MSRLSDILGVKEGQEFRFDGSSPYRIVGDVREMYIDDKWYISFSEKNLCRMIAHPELIKIVPKKITLTEQQITAIKGRIAEGTPWAAKDKDNNKQTWFFETKPEHSDSGIFEPNEVGHIVSVINTHLYNFITFENSPIYLPDLIKE